MADAGEGPCRARLRSRVFLSAEVVSPRSQPMPRLTTRCGSVLASGCCLFWRIVPRDALVVGRRYSVLREM